MTSTDCHSREARPLMSRAARSKLLAGGSAPARQVPFLCSCKEKKPKESTPRMAPLSSPPRLWVPRCPTRHPASRASARIPVAPLRALAQSLTGLGCAIRGLKNTFARICHVGEHGDDGFRVPVARAEHRSPSGSFQASPCLSPSRVVCGRRVGERPLGRGAQGSCRRLRGVILLVTFSWTSKRKSPWVRGGAIPIQTRGRRPLDLRPPLETP